MAGAAVNGTAVELLAADAHQPERVGATSAEWARRVGHEQLTPFVGRKPRAHALHGPEA